MLLHQAAHEHLLTHPQPAQGHLLTQPQPAHRCLSIHILINSRPSSSRILSVISFSFNKSIVLLRKSCLNHRHIRVFQTKHMLVELMVLRRLSSSLFCLVLFLPFFKSIIEFREKIGGFLFWKPSSQEASEQFLLGHSKQEFW